MTVSALREKLSLYLDLIRVKPPVGWLLLTWPTLAALWLAAGGWPGWHLFMVFALGPFLMHSAGCCINDVADREFDRHVKRTLQRPVTTGRISVPEALAVGAVLALAGLGMALTINWQTVVCAVPALLSMIVYPYSKRWFAMPQAVLGASFGFGILMAYTAAQGRLPLEAILLFFSAIIYTLGYDTSYAMVDRDDDLKIGIQTSAITLGRMDVAAITGFYAIFLLAWLSIIAWHFIGAGLPQRSLLWLCLGFAAAVVQVAWHYTLIRRRTREGCHRAFLNSHWISSAVFAGIVIGLA
ncbi:MAG: UbiA family prenyltransferase [Burkholderiaceae bacterium]|jgi:4-hydroxybenzoate polyprenyltransferase|nr:UbiA family prenyltransferase [Burkholderiaceae bacterium]